MAANCSVAVKNWPGHNMSVIFLQNFQREYPQEKLAITDRRMDKSLAANYSETAKKLARYVSYLPTDLLEAISTKSQI